MNNTKSLQSGTLGKYKLLDLIGTGSLGLVFLAEIVEYNNDEAFKKNQRQLIRKGTQIVIKKIPNSEYL